MGISDRKPVYELLRLRQKARFVCHHSQLGQSACGSVGVVASLKGEQKSPKISIPLLVPWKQLPSTSADLIYVTQFVCDSEGQFTS